MKRKGCSSKDSLEQHTTPKRQRLGTGVDVANRLYEGKVSDTDKAQMLQLHLNQIKASTCRYSVVQVATMHRMKRDKDERLLSRLQSHVCNWDCVIPSEAFDALQDISIANKEGTIIYDTTVDPEQKDSITRAILTQRYAQMSSDRQKRLCLEHRLPWSSADPAGEIFDRHYCSNDCQIRVEDVRCYHSKHQPSSRAKSERDKDRQQRCRQNKQKAAEALEEADINFWHDNWPQIESESILNEILQESCDTTKSRNLRYLACSFCDAWRPAGSMFQTAKELLDITVLEDNVAKIRAAYPRCPVQTHRESQSDDYIVCEACWRHTCLNDKKDKYIFKDVPLLSWANLCWVGPVPDELQGLTYVEELVIARAHTTKCWTKLNVASNVTTQQRSASGNVCIHPHDITSIATFLPPPVNTLYDEIVVIFVKDDKEATASMYEKTPLLARRGRILRALRWLKENNPLYADIIIDYEALKQYPETGVINFPAQYESPQFTPSGQSTTYTGHGIDKIEEIFRGEDSHEGDSIPLSKTGSLDVNREEMSLQRRKIDALQHIKKGGSFLTTVESNAVTLSTRDTPELYGYLWPTLFPYGTGYFDEPLRNTDGFHPIHTATHSKHVLRLSDRRFQCHMSFIFVMHNILIRRRSSYQTKVAVKRTWWPRAMRIMRTVEHNTFNKMKDEMLKRRAMKDFSPYYPKNDEEKKVLQLLKYVSFVDNHIEGSIGEVGIMREELRAISRYCGTPSFFITINPADAHHPLVSFFAGKDIDMDRLFDNPDSRYTCLKRAQILSENPVAGATFFDFIVKRFISIFLGCGRKSKRGVFGRVKHYYFCVEAQNRGSLHVHGLIWPEGALSPKQIQERCRTDTDFRLRFFSWLESIIKLSLPHTHAAHSNPTKNITYSESKRSLLGQPPEPEDIHFQGRWSDHLREVLECVGQRHTHGDVCFKKSRLSAASMTTQERDEKCRFHLPAEIVESTYMDDDGRINLKRADSMVSGYNPTITGAHQCNTDIKFVGSGRTGLAMAYYMANYTAKSTLDSAIVISAMCAAIKALQAKNEGATFTEEEDQCQLLLTKTLNQMIARRELSAQQVASSLLGIRNHYTNALFARVYWSSVLSWLCADEFPSNLTSDEEEDGVDEDESEIVSGSTNSILNPEAQNSDEWIIINSIATDETNLPPRRSQVFDILYRPPQLEHLCWWDIISQYEKEKLPANHTPSKESQSEDTLQDSDAPRYLFFESKHPQSATHAFKRRKQLHIPVLIGYAIPRRGEDIDQISDRYAVTMLALFRPWKRDPSCPVKDDSESWTQAYKRWISSVDSHKMTIMEHFEEVWQCREAADEYSRSRRAAEQDENSATSGNPTTGDSRIYDDPMFHFAQADMDDNDFESESILPEDEFSITCSNRTKAEIVRILSLAKLWSLYTLPPKKMHTSNANACCFEVDVNDRSMSSAAQDKLAAEKAKYKALRKETINSLVNCEQAKASGVSIVGSSRCTTISEEIERYEERIGRQSAAQRDCWRSLHAWHKAAIVICERFTLNREQRQVFLLIADHRTRKVFDADLAPLRMIIGGPGGSGKSHIFDAVQSFYDYIGLSHEIAFTAPTGIAADGIHGSTTHSFLSLNADYNKMCEANSKTRNELAEKLAITKLMIIDEVYFVSCREFHKVSKNLKLGRGFCDDSMGGMNIVVSGDQFQLACPLGQPLFTKDYADMDHNTQGQSDTVNEELRGFTAFRGFSDCVILKEIIRQKNPRYMAFINRLRWGMCTTSGPDNDFDYIRRFCAHSAYGGMNDVGADVGAWLNDPTTAAPLITFTNAVRDVHNWEMCKSFAVASGQQFKIYYAEDYVCGEKRGSRIKLTGRNAIAAWNTSPKKNAEDLAGRLPLVRGMPVILVENLAVELGLCKSTRGTLLRVHYFIRDGKRYAVCAEVEFPSYKGEGDSKVITVPAVRRAFKYEVHGERFGGYREQIPLAPGFSFTIHNSQSQSLNSVIAHLDSAPGTAAAYVIMSRIKCTESGPINLRIIGNVKKTKISTHVAPQVREEERRLQALAAETARRGRQQLGWFETITGESVF